MSPVFPVFYTVTTVSWSQKIVQNDNIHVFMGWHLLTLAYASLTGSAWLIKDSIPDLRP